MPPRRPNSPPADDAPKPSGGASRNDRTELRPSPFANGERSRAGARPRSVEVDEEYHTSNHYPDEGEEDAEEGTPTPSARSVRRPSGMDALSEQEEDDEPLPEEDDDNPDATRAGPPVSLHIVEGPDQGKKRRFKGVRMVVGRGKKIELQLSDQSVSRRHLELIHSEAGTLMRDLGTINGTLVNDERVDEKLLTHGDVIAIGKTRIRYVDELAQVKQMRAEQEAREAEEKKAAEEAQKKAEADAAARKDAAANTGAASKDEVDPADPRFNQATQARFPAPQELLDAPVRPRPGRGGDNKFGGNKVLIGGGIGVAVVVALVVAIILMGRPSQPEVQPPDPKEAVAATKMQQAYNAVRSGDFALAVKLIEEAEALKPGIDTEGLAQAARKELAVMEAFQAVRALMDEERFEEARQKLKDTPLGTTAQSDEEREKLEKELDERELAFLVKRAEALLEQRDVEGLRALVARLPPSAQPLYRQKLADLEKALEDEAKELARQGRQNKALAAKLAAEKRAQFIAEAFEAVERKFDNGDYARAVLECDRVMEAHKGDTEIRDRAKSLKRLIPQFAKSFEDAQRKVQARSLEAAVRPLKRSSELYQQIGFNGGLQETLNEQLARASVSAGKAALARRDVASAARSFREALRINPGDAGAQDGLNSLEGQVEELFKRAYIERDRDPRSAAEKFRIVIDASPPDSELRQKAETHLQALQP
ncbi:FHA domain-containing protein [Stigmatella hybrida]|uniref:FHA domain-containing protein n=1 Tax=Stigmatella hybrida TaxID=394097 RepID=UPI001CDB2120|nr:FHA domain-containing protein [Stigmatella hybrida]